MQRLLVFLGYSTSSSGSFVVDGDFGRGTNRGVAQFQYEHDLRSRLQRRDLCYPCTFRTARKRITAIPESRVDLATLDAMARAALAAADSAEIPLGRLEDALFHLNALEEGRLLRCDEILTRYGVDVDSATRAVAEADGVETQPEWVLAIIRQETAGVIRPRFEQHKLSKLNQEHPRTSLAELRIRSMSMGLGQIMGFKYHLVDAPYAQAMITAPVDQQVLYVTRFTSKVPHIVQQHDPSQRDFRGMARLYNGPKYRDHFYDERLAQWFREFRHLRSV